MWIKVTKPEEVNVGERVRYRDRHTTCGYNEDDKRFVGKNKKHGVDADNAICSGDIFDGWLTVEVWREQSEQPAPNKPSDKPAQKKSSAPIHRGYEWDGVVYVLGRIGDRDLTEHFKLVSETRAKLAELNKQTARYKALERRGLQ